MVDVGNGGMKPHELRTSWDTMGDGICSARSKGMASCPDVRNFHLPSGKRLHSYGKIQHFIAG